VRIRSGESLRKVKTPPGVWVIVGLGVFFVIIALGISAYIVVKSVGETKGKNALRKVQATLAEGSYADTLRQPHGGRRVTTGRIHRGGDAFDPALVDASGGEPPVLVPPNSGGRQKWLPMGFRLGEPRPRRSALPGPIAGRANFI
jgi:hypothetical protein